MRYGVLLRGINVGGKRVEMARLKSCLESAGLLSVVTLLNSGNVVFEASEPAKASLNELISAAIENEFGFDVGLFIYTIAELEQVVSDYPFDRSDPAWHAYAIFVTDGIGPELIEISRSFPDSEGSWALGGNVVYWRTPKGTTVTSDFSKSLSKTRYKAKNTVRNLNTLEKMLALQNR